MNEEKQMVKNIATVPIAPNRFHSPALKSRAA